MISDLTQSAFDNDGGPWIGLFLIPIAVSILGGATAVFVAVFRRGDRGLVLLLPALFFLAAVLFVVGEITSPH